MTHDDVRAALASDEPVPREAREHLARCDACVAFAKGLDRVRRTAPMLVPAGPPAGLEERVLTALAGEPAATVVPLPARRSFGRRALVRVAVGVAATVAIAVGAAVVERDVARTPAMTLAAAASRTESAGTARLRVEGTTTFVLPVRPRSLPDFGSVPEEMRARLETQWRETVRAFLEETAKRQRQLDALIGRLPSQLPVPRLPRVPTAPPAPPLPDLPPLPESITATVTFRAEGDVEFGDRLRLAGVVGAGGEARVDVVSARDGLAVRAEGAGWTTAATDVGPWSVVVGGPDALVRFVREAVEVRREGGLYHFRVHAPDGTRLDGQAMVTDGRLSWVRLVASGRTAALVRWTTTLRVDITDPGAPVEARPVQPRDVRDAAPRPEGASALLYPLGPGVRAAAGR